MKMGEVPSIGHRFFGCVFHLYIYFAYFTFLPKTGLFFSGHIRESKGI